MSTLIIYPLDDSNVEVPYVLDCDEVDISLTFSVQDIQDVTKRRGSFSKTITLPGTGPNNQALDTPITSNRLSVALPRTNESGVRYGMRASKPLLVLCSFLV